MSNPDSFIDEVTEEIRRDRLFGLMRRYGWIGIVLVLGVVGGAAWTEWSKAQSDARAQSFGDAVLSSLEMSDAAARRDALAAVPASGAQSGVVGLLLAGSLDTDRDAAIAALDGVAADADLGPEYRDLAVLRRVLLQGAAAPTAERRAALEPLATPGRPFRTLALEQIAYIDAEDGDTAAAIAGLTALTQDQEATPGLRRRAEQMVVALGGALAPAASTAEQAG